MQENIIKKVVLQLGKKEVELTLEEAQELKAALDKLFVTEKHYSSPLVWPRPYPYYSHSTWVDGSATRTTGLSQAISN